MNIKQDLIYTCQAHDIPIREWINSDISITNFFVFVLTEENKYFHVVIKKRKLIILPEAKGSIGISQNYLVKEIEEKGFSALEEHIEKAWGDFGGFSLQEVLGD